MSDDIKKCPFCGGEIKATAKKCKHCKQFLPNEEENVVEPTTKTCPFCGEEILAIAKKCKYCKQFLSKDGNQIKSEDVQVQSYNNRNIICTIIGVIVGIVLLCIIYNSSSNSFLNGCDLENERDIGSIYGPVGFTQTYYCKNNKLYDEVNIKYRDGNKYPDYYFINTSYGKIAKYYRKDGEYYCSLYNNKEDIASCYESKMLKLIKTNADKIKDEIESDKAKEKIAQKVSNLMYAYSDLNRDRCVFNNECSQSLSCKDVITANYKNQHNIQDIKGCQFIDKDGVIVALGKDARFATVYDSDNPRYYINIKYNGNPMRSWFEYPENRIPADNYVKNYERAKQLSKDEMNNIDTKLHSY